MRCFLTVAGLKYQKGCEIRTFSRKHSGFNRTEQLQAMRVKRQFPCFLEATQLDVIFIRSKLIGSSQEQTVAFLLNTEAQSRAGK